VLHLFILLKSGAEKADTKKQTPSLRLMLTWLRNAF